jgi:multidrug efflux system membrane fusion protein
MQGVWVTGVPREADVIVVGQEFVTDGVIVDPTFTEAVQ